ncbi:MAG: sigma-54-dependent Fis family transcriptional regulator [Phycisphaerae bacterium]|nr:sigma-54-dependent Fis family transcriptional regulator [Phycisphaerae bacterium]
MARTAFILILLDNDDAGARLRDALRAQTGHSCRAVGTLDEALESIRHKAPDIVVTPAQLNGQAMAPPLAGLLDRVARDSSLVLIGANPAPLDARNIQVVLLPEKDDIIELVDPIARAAKSAAARRDDRLLEKSIAEHRHDVFEGIVGSSAAMKRIVELIRKAAPKGKLNVLILGETGTGKDLIAQAIHKRSSRSHRPFLPLNCAGINESLLESQLFGHVKGAFTGADRDRKGYFEAADGGTLFLDEIGDMPKAMQAKLLRALDHREITPVGSTEVRRVDVRLIAATHVDLQRSVDEGRFREDLLYRLNHWVIHVPPLRERREDIPLLAMHLLERANETHGTSVPGLSNDAMESLAKYVWRGNVRELASVIEAIAVAVEDRTIEADDLPERIRGPRDLVPVSGGMVGLTMAEMERMMIERTLQATGGNREQAAKMLDIGTRTLYRKLKEYGIS